MDSALAMLLFFGTMAAGALMGMAVRRHLPADHTADSSRDAVLRSVGLVVTMAAIVVGFLVSSAKQYYGTVEDQLTEIAADVASLDRVLVRYGTEAGPARQVLRQSVDEAVGFVWSGEGSSLPQNGRGSALKTSDRLYDTIDALPNGNPRQATLRDQALGQLAVIQHAGLKLSRIAQARPQAPMLAVVLSWLVIIFVGFGLVSPQTGTARVSILLAAVAVSGALFLIVELYSPVSGMLMIPPSILEGAIAPVGPH